LYADDDPDDQSWVTDACRATGSRMDIRFVQNGKQALNYLQDCAAHELPVLIVLDLNMPELDGRQALQRIKANERYREIPVVIVTTSSNLIDQEICRRLGANLYLTKPDTHTEWQNIIRQLEPFCGFE
jgi:CheY-like chemotaxis protein